MGIGFEGRPIEHRPNRRQPPVAAIPVQAVSHQEVVSDLKAAVFQGHLDQPTHLPVQKGNRGNGSRGTLSQQPVDGVEVETGVHHVHDHDHVSSTDTGEEVHGDTDIGALPVAFERQELDLHLKIHVPHQVRQKAHRSLHYPHHHG